MTSLLEKYHEHIHSLQIFTQLMNIPEFARHIKKALWIPHPSAELIKEVFAKTKLYCDNTKWSIHSRINTHILCDVYPAHLIRQLRRSYIYNIKTRKTSILSTLNCEFTSNYNKSFPIIRRIEPDIGDDQYMLQCQ